MVKCPNCTSTSFKVEEVVPEKSNFKLLFVACRMCNTTVGVMDYWNIGAVVKNLEKKIESIERDSSSLKGAISTVNDNIGRLMQMIGRLK